MRRYRHLAVLTAMVHDETSGRVYVEGDRPRIRYRMIDSDRAQVVRTNATHKAQLMRSKIPKIGMYSAMTIEPMIAPMTTIMSGSMRLVSCSVVDSTSSS